MPEELHSQSCSSFLAASSGLALRIDSPSLRQIYRGLARSPSFLTLDSSDSRCFQCQPRVFSSSAECSLMSCPNPSSLHCTWEADPRLGAGHVWRPSCGFPPSQESQSLLCLDHCPEVDVSCVFFSGLVPVTPSSFPSIILISMFNSCLYQKVPGPCSRGCGLSRSLGVSRLCFSEEPVERQLSGRQG